MFKRIKLWLSRNESFVIADPRDNSITFSKGLCKQINISALEAAKVAVFTVKTKDPKPTYGFIVNPELENTQLADIMYNSKHKCVGFECLVPTVNRIFYDYGIKHYDKPCKFSVGKEVVKRNKLTYFTICRPE